MITKVTMLNRTGSYFNKGQGKTMYNFDIAFDNDERGQCSAMSEDPPYFVGSVVEVKKAGEFNGMPKFSVKKSDEPYNGSDGGEPIPEKQSQETKQFIESTVRPQGIAKPQANGARSGMLMNNACNLMASSKTDPTEDNIMSMMELLDKCMSRFENQPVASPVDAQATSANDEDVPF